MNPLGFPFTNLAKICKDAAVNASNPSRQSKNAGLALWFYHEVPWRPPLPATRSTQLENKIHHITYSKHTRSLIVSLWYTLPLPCDKVPRVSLCHLTNDFRLKCCSNRKTRQNSYRSGRLLRSTESCLCHPFLHPFLRLSCRFYLLFHPSLLYFFHHHFSCLSLFLSFEIIKVALKQHKFSNKSQRVGELLSWSPISFSISFLFCPVPFSYD